MRLNRRRFLQAGAAGAAGAALLPNAGCSMDETGSSERPNILLLIIDSLRPDHVGAYGSPRVKTPNVDRVAARGLRFNRAFPEAMVTIPARRSIFTTKRIFPYRNFVPNEELGSSPGWLPIVSFVQTSVDLLELSPRGAGVPTCVPTRGGAPAQPLKIMHDEVAWATVRPRSSVSVACASAVRRPRWMTVPSHVSSPESTVTERRNFVVRSREV